MTQSLDAPKVSEQFQDKYTGEKLYVRQPFRKQNGNNGQKRDFDHFYVDSGLQD